MITKNEFKIIELMLYRKECSVEDLANLFSVDKYIARNMVESINTTLDFFNFKNKIVLDNDNIFIDRDFEEEWRINSNKIGSKTVYHQKVRIYLDALYLLLSEDKQITIHSIEQVSNVSKNTVISDLKKLKQNLMLYNLSLKNDRRKGYFISGDINNKLLLIIYLISRIISEPFGENAIGNIYEFLDIQIEKYQIMDYLNQCEDKYNISFVYDRVLPFIYIIMALSKVKIDDRDKINFFEISKRSSDIAKNICLAFKLNLNLKYFVETMIISSITGISFVKDNKYFIDLTNRIINETEKYIGVSFEEKETLSNQLYDHLIPAFYRIKNGIPLKNEMEETIKIEYKDLFSLIKKSLHPLEEELMIELPDSEVAYFTIHFGGYLTLHEEQPKKQIKALILCPNGVTSSVLLKSELSLIFKDFKFFLSNNLFSVDEEEYDVIFSTHVIGISKKYFIVKPLMNVVEKKLLKKSVYYDLGIFDDVSDFANIENIMNIIKSNATIKNEKKLYKELSYELFSKNIDNSSRKGAGLDLNEFLTEEFIQISNKKMSWEESIRLASESLLSKGYITENYVSTMIENVVKHGNYIVLAPHVAVPHARPEDGGKKVGFSLLVCKEPVDFNQEGENDRDNLVKLIFVLSAIDNNSHLNALKQLSDILDEDEKIDNIFNSKDKEEIIYKINHYIEEEN